jgi:hypothetical protein
LVLVFVEEVLRTGPGILNRGEPPAKNEQTDDPADQESDGRHDNGPPLVFFHMSPTFSPPIGFVYSLVPAAANFLAVGARQQHLFSSR